MFRLAIVGSRDLDGFQASTVKYLSECILWDALTQYEQELEFVSGGAEGVDTISEGVAHDYQIPVRIFYPEGKSWPSYRERNIEIVKYCDKLVCMQSKQSGTYGSGWTADYAAAQGKDVVRLWV